MGNLKKQMKFFALVIAAAAAVNLKSSPHYCSYEKDMHAAASAQHASTMAWADGKEAARSKVIADMAAANAANVAKVAAGHAHQDQHGYAGWSSPGVGCDTAQCHHNYPNSHSPM